MKTTTGYFNVRSTLHFGVVDGNISRWQHAKLNIDYKEASDPVK